MHLLITKDVKDLFNKGQCSLQRMKIIFFLILQVNLICPRGEQSEERHIIYSVSQGESTCSGTGQRRGPLSTASVMVSQHAQAQVRGEAHHLQRQSRWVSMLRHWSEERHIIYSVSQGGSVCSDIGQGWWYSQTTDSQGRPRVAVFTENSLSR